MAQTQKAHPLEQDADHIDGSYVPPVEVRKKKASGDKGEGLWLMSFSDMSLILMSFFVLQLSYSSPDKRKYENLDQAIKQTPSKESTSLSNISKKLIDEIKAKKLEEIAEVKLDASGLTVEFKEKSLFSSGSAEPDRKSARLVNDIMKVLAIASHQYQIVFEGHTDDTPVSGGRYRSNWELSSSRALALLNDFKARGVDEQKMTIKAYAHTRPKKPVKGLSGDALKQARAQNRRVVIRLE